MSLLRHKFQGKLTSRFGMLNGELKHLIFHSKNFSTGSLKGKSISRFSQPVSEMKEVVGKKLRSFSSEVTCQQFFRLKYFLLKMVEQWNVLLTVIFSDTIHDAWSDPLKIQSALRYSFMSHRKKNFKGIFMKLNMYCISLGFELGVGQRGNSWLIIDAILSAITSLKSQNHINLGELSCLNLKTTNTTWWSDREGETP